MADLATRALAVTADPEAAAAGPEQRRLGAGLFGPPGRPRSRRSSPWPTKRPVPFPPWPGKPWPMRPPSRTSRARATGRAAVDRLLTRMGPSGDAGPQQAWIRACTDPFGSRGELVAYLRQTASSPAGGIGEVADRFCGLAAGRIRAWGCSCCRTPCTSCGRPGTQGTSGGGLTALGWLYVDTGRWDQALEAAAEAADWAEANQMGIVAATADVLAATVLGPAGGWAGRPHPRGPGPGRGRPGGKRADRGCGAGGRSGSRPLAEGDHLLAFTLLRRLFSEEGAPVHNIFSYLGVADLATAAVRADQRREGRIIVERALGHRAEHFRPGWSSSSPGPAASWPTRPVPEPTSPGRSATPPVSSGPFERAQLRSTYAEWAAAAAPDQRSQGRNWSTRWRPSGAWGPRSLAQRTEAELRASGGRRHRRDRGGRRAHGADPCSSARSSVWPATA